MKKIVAVPLHEQRNPTYTKLFGVSLQDLHQQGLTENGVPAIVGSIVEYLTRHGLTQEGLFRVNGNVKVVEQLRWKFESGVPVELGRDGDVCAAASLLKLFLRELPESVITSTLQPRFLQLFQEDRNDAQESNLRALIEELPDTHYCLLKYLCQFLTKVAKHHVQNRMNVHNLATVFGPNCFQWSCVPSLLFTWGQTMVEVMKIMATSFKSSHACTTTLSTPNPASGRHQPTPPPKTPGHFWANLRQSLVGSLLLSPGSWCTQGSVCVLQESISQSCVSSGSSMVGLMVTSSKRTYAIPKSAAPRAPASAAAHC